MTITVDVHSDVICPWCWIGKRRLEQALSALGARAGTRVAWHPFQLNPGMPSSGMPRAEYRARKFGSIEHARALDARVTAVAAEAGLSFHLDLQQRTPNTMRAHRLIWLAGRRGVQDAVVEGLFSAYFTAGLDVGDPAVLTGIAAANGIPAAEAEVFLVGREGEDEMVEAERSVRAEGADGVPWFAIGEERIGGAQPVAVFLAALARAAGPAAGAR